MRKIATILVLALAVFITLPDDMAFASSASPKTCYVTRVDLHGHHAATQACASYQPQTHPNLVGGCTNPVLIVWTGTNYSSYSWCFFGSGVWNDLSQIYVGCWPFQCRPTLYKTIGSFKSYNATGFFAWNLDLGSLHCNWYQNGSVNDLNHICGPNQWRDQPSSLQIN